MYPKALVANTYGHTLFSTLASTTFKGMLTRLYLVQQRDVPSLVNGVSRRDVRDDVQVFDVRYLLVESSQLVEMRGEEAEGVNLRGDMSM